jgi:hypothetical protein
LESSEYITDMLVSIDTHPATMFVQRWAS